jgi:hypothetical protein
LVPIAPAPWIEAGTREGARALTAWGPCLATATPSPAVVTTPAPYTTAVPKPTVATASVTTFRAKRLLEPHRADGEWPQADQRQKSLAFRARL